MNVFFIDDDEDDFLTFSEAVYEINPGVVVAHFDDADKALAALEQTTPDCIFLDLNLPKMNGLELLQLLRTNKAFSKIPIIIFTTSTYPPDKRKVAELAGTAFIHKPSSFGDLVDLLRPFFEHI